ncbi:MAG: branched-chain amino acid ABC transporter permease [Deinococcus sp.]|nr:branched-chain amino acid ABC transporter permease [Deinococcus sp.]
MTLAQFLQQTINGLSLGSLYALLAIGYSMVYGILRLINFAHGEIFMLGAFFAFYTFTFTGLPWWVAMLVSMVLTAGAGLLLERLAYRPLRDSPRTTVLITAIAISFLLQNAGQMIFGAQPKPFAPPSLLLKPLQFELAGNRIFLRWTGVLVPIITLALLYLLTLLVQRTRIGKAMRAVAQDTEVARMMGINVNFVVAITFVVGSALAAAGGVMWGMTFRNIQPLMGIFPGIKAFIAAVVGGIGSLPGAMLGGYLLGLAEVWLVALLSLFQSNAFTLTTYRDVLVFAILILILLFRPHGIIGEGTAEKV